MVFNYLSNKKSDPFSRCWRPRQYLKQQKVITGEDACNGGKLLLILDKLTKRHYTKKTTLSSRFFYVMSKVGVLTKLVF